MIENIDNLHIALRLWRQAAGKTQQEWADMLGVSQSSIVAWEKPGATIKVRHVLRIMQHVGVDSVHDFLRGPAVENYT